MIFCFTGDCFAKENLTAVSHVARYSGEEYNLTVPMSAVASLKLYCPFISSYFTLRVFHNATEIKGTNVFFDSPREDLFFDPIRSPDLPSAKYQCYAINNLGFDQIDYYLFKNYSNISIYTSLRVREDDVIQVNLTDMCLPFSSKFLTSSDLTGVTTTSSLVPPVVSFTLNNLTLTDYNLTVAQLSHNGIYSCLVTHSLYQAQIQILDLYVKPLNVCAHSNGGCEHLCNTDIIADSFNCSCRPGYQLTSDLFGCEDVDECISVSLHNCPIPSQVCKNEPAGSYSCECAAGYVLESGGECLDVDECVHQNGGCLHLCLNTPGSYFCECKFGYTLLPIDNMTCVDLTSVELDTPPSLLTPIILALVFGIIFLLSVFIIALLLIAVCKRSRTPTRLKYDMFSKRLSGDFKCHQQVANPVFKLDQSSLFSKRISPRKNQASYGVLDDDDFHYESQNTKPDHRRPRSLEQAALSGEVTSDLDYLNEDVVLPKILTTDTSPSLPKYEHSQSSKISDTSSPSQRKYLPHSNMVPVLPSLGDGIQLRSVKSNPRNSSRDTNSQISDEILLDQTFC